jgi:hypothetical protein
MVSASKNVLILGAGYVPEPVVDPDPTLSVTAGK